MVELDISTKLSYDRTRLAYENTMMAWVRTATSLITFGFSVYKFFQFDVKRVEGLTGAVGPREFGLMMITFGLVSLAAGTVQHITSMRQLRKQNPGMPRSIAALLAFLISFLGIFALIAVLFRQ
jgi:putative membrane protein